MPLKFLHIMTLFHSHDGSAARSLRRGAVVSFILPALAVCTLASCENELPTIGSSLATGEVAITVDSLKLAIPSSSVFDDAFDSRGTVTLLGSLYAEPYGTLTCSYAARLIPATSLPLPDSITAAHIDSLSILVRVSRGALAGDSLAPQQLRVYALTKQLPSDIRSDFDPTSYYDNNSLLGSRSYTLSVLGANDTVYRKKTIFDIPVTLPREDALKVFEAYKAGDPAFGWPQAFAQKMPGVYVEPSFGMGAVADVGNTTFALYYHYTTTETSVDEEGNVIKLPKNNVGAVPVFSTGPEALSASRVKYTPSESVKALVAAGTSLITTPGGYTVRMRLPMERVLEEYNTKVSALTLINNLSVTIPARAVENDYGIKPPKTLLMVKASEAPTFFSQMRVPDGKNAFYANYDEEKGYYSFSSMRDYVIDLAGKGSVTDDDCTFVAIPVTIVTEDYYDYDERVNKTLVTLCQRYFSLPTMVELETDKSTIVFTYSSQSIR